MISCTARFMVLRAGVNGSIGLVGSARDVEILGAVVQVVRDGMRGN